MLINILIPFYITRKQRKNIKIVYKILFKFFKVSREKKKRNKRIDLLHFIIITMLFLCFSIIKLLSQYIYCLTGFF